MKKHIKHSGEDLSVFIQFKEPIRVKKLKVIPNMRKLGPVYKGKAKKIAEALEKLEVREKDVKEVEVQIDGETIKVSNEFFEVKEIEEEIHGEKVVPHVIEPSFGLDRIAYTILEHSFDKDTVDGEERKVLRLKRWMSPVQVAVLPLLSKDEFIKVSLEIVNMLRNAGIYTEYDDSGSIGRRYRRFDEIGTPFCVTVDHQTLEDRTVTIRDRDTTRQIRVEIDRLVSVLKELLSTERDIAEFGELFRG